MVLGTEDSRKASSCPHRAHSLERERARQVRHEAIRARMGEAQASLGVGEASGVLGCPKEETFLAWRRNLRNFASRFLISKE